MKYAELPKYIAEGPLYQPKHLEIPSVAEAAVIVENRGIRRARFAGFPVPKELADHHCPRCGKPQNWRWDGIPGGAETASPGINQIPYECKNCGTEPLIVWLRVWVEKDRVMVEKVGQYPKLAIALPTDFEKALGDSKSHYIKGMASRHAGYGIGALGYFRRVIDDTIGEMLGVLEAAMIETGADPTAIETVRRAKAGKVFEERVKLAAEALPAHLKPGGMNPFADLYDLHSAGLHAMSDEECSAIVDAMDTAMKYVYTELKGHAEGAAQYKAAATTIQQTLAAVRAKKSGQSAP